MQTALEILFAALVLGWFYVTSAGLVAAGVQ